MKKVVALVTTYFPTQCNSENVRTISEQVSAVIVSDNTPDTDNSALFSNIPNLIYIANHKNMGLSQALNECLKKDICKNSDYIIFFDQDSKIKEGHIAALVTDFETLRPKYNVGYIGPVFYDTNTNEVRGTFYSSVNVMQNIWTVPATITSSVLTTYKNLQKVGFWNENVFLDYADLDLGWRFSHAGFTNFVTQNCQLEHTLGNSIKEISLPFRKRKSKVVIHNPVRLYYQVRDGLKLLFQAYVPHIGKKTIITECILRLYVHIAYMNDKRQSIHYWGKGFFDGVRHYSGPIKE